MSRLTRDELTDMVWSTPEGLAQVQRWIHAKLTTSVLPFSWHREHVAIADSWAILEMSRGAAIEEARENDRRGGENDGKNNSQRPA